MDRGTEERNGVCEEVTIQLIVNGKIIYADVDDTAMKNALEKKEEKPTGYEVPKNRVDVAWSEKCPFENGLMMCKIGCFYSDAHVAADNARADQLMTNLRKFAAEHGGCMSPSLAVSGNVCCYSIRYNSNWSDPITYGIYNQGNSVYGGVLFYNESAVLAAIERFHGELLWYFTKYNPMPEGWCKD